MPHARRIFLSLLLVVTVITASGTAVLVARDDARPSQVLTASAREPDPPPQALVDSLPRSAEHESIQQENLFPGDSSWQIVHGDTTHIGAYPLPASAAPGQTIDFHIASTDSSGVVRLYRLGWYHGARGRLMLTKPDVPFSSLRYLSADSGRTAQVDASTAFTLIVPPRWRSGIYVARITTTSGYEQLVPFWVRSSDHVAPILVVSGYLTYQAYNDAAGGTNFYTAPRASALSFNRSFTRNNGLGDLSYWELPFVSWLERSGLDADYETDLDIHMNAQSLGGRKLIVIPGHSEYWTNEIRQRLEDAVDGGTNLAVFSANAGYWRIRLEDDRTNVDRVMVCYKLETPPDKRTSVDPVSDPRLTTGRFRDFANPEAALLGGEYRSYLRGDKPGFNFVVKDASSWVFEGTGLHNGDTLVGIVDQEFDGIVPRQSPPGVQILAAATVVTAADRYDTAEMTMYIRASGATVFDGGSLTWPMALDDIRYAEVRGKTVVDARLQRIAENIVTRLSR